MSIVGFIVLGDRTSHGGTVVSADPVWTIDGQPVARIGDLVTCPRCKRTSTIIYTPFPPVFTNGRPTAYDQAMTDCGAVVYSRHNNHAGWSDDSVEPAPPPTQERLEHVRPPRFHEYFILKSNDTGKPITGLPYTIKTADGKTLEGQTDSEGRTDIAWTDTSLPIEVIVHPPNDRTQDDPYHFDDDLDYGGL